MPLIGGLTARGEAALRAVLSYNYIIYEVRLSYCFEDLIILGLILVGKLRVCAITMMKTIRDSLAL